MFGELCMAYFIVLYLKWSADENERLWSGDRINMSWSITCEMKTLQNCSWLGALLYISVCCCCWMNANAITFLLTIWMNGRAVLYKMNATLIKIPMMMPNSSDNMRQAKSVVMKGIMSTRLQRQISTISCVSTMKIIAQMITAARVLFGMYWKESVRNPNDSSTMHPVTMPPSVVRTPLALFTAVRVNDPVVGIDWKKEPHKLHRPSASISWVASMVLPLAKMEIVWYECLVDKIRWYVLTKWLCDSNTFQNRYQWNRYDGWTQVGDHFKTVKRSIANGSFERWKTEIWEPRRNFTCEII